MQSMSCRSCGATLNDRDLDRRLAIITCGHCGRIYDLTKDQRTEQSDGDKSLKARPVAPLPDKFHLEQVPGTLTISWRWIGLKDLFLVPFTIAWNSFLFTSLSGPGGFDFFLTAHLAAGVYLTYQVLADLLNTTTVTVDSRNLAVRHRPLPWWPAPTIDVADIEQFYAVERISHGKNSTSISYDVLAVGRDNGSIKVLRGLEDVGQALYLEQIFEQIMRIRDRPVAGEVRKDSVYS